MALYGVLGDIHGNYEALASVLERLDAEGIERLVCLGDIVGYNADAELCTRVIRDRGALSIAGNHDLIGLGRLGFARCSNKAMYSLKQTRRRLTPESRRYLASLPANRVLDAGIVLIHGGVRDVEQYMVTTGLIARNAQYASADFPQGRIFFFGHTHEQKVYEVVHEVSGDRVLELPISNAMTLREDRRYFINPGSIDASRKREHKLAEYAIIDSATLRIAFHRIPYDDVAVEAKAARDGYRIGPWIDRFYSLRKRVSEAVQRRI